MCEESVTTGGEVTSMIMRDNEGRGTGDKGEDEDEGEMRATTLCGA